MLFRSQCTHFKDPSKFVPITYKKWEDYVLNKAYEYLENDMEVVIDYLPNTYDSDYKIITKKYKQ